MKIKTNNNNIYIGRFDCPNCPNTIKDLSFIINDMEIYCDKCNTKLPMLLIDVRLKI